MLRASDSHPDMRRLLLTFALPFLLASSTLAQSAEPVGLWVGPLNTPGGTLTMVFRVSPGPDGLAATMEVVEQQTGALAVDVSASGDSLQFAFAPARIEIAGVVSGDTFTGTFTQGGDLPLVLTRQSADPEAALSGDAVEPPNRPQTPQPPFPYREETVRVESEPGVTIEGTLTLPEGDGPFPAAVLIPGSGPQDRDWDIADHQIAVVWADWLARAGIASYRFDERGVGASTGDWASAGIPDFALDAGAAVQHLSTRSDIASVGVVGHSEGGYIAPRVATTIPDVAFVVTLAGPGVLGAEVYAEQHRLLAMAEGLAEAPAGLYSEMVAALVAPYADPERADDDTRRAEGLAAARAVLDAADDALRFAYTRGQDVTPTMNAILDFVATPAIGSFLVFDPRPDLEALAVPTLAVFAERDLQVPPAQSAGAVRDALAASRAPSHAVLTFANLNHLFQPTQTGAIAEYAQIETTVNEEVLEAVTRWIAAQTD
ncbi:MAG TPA: alpha/beta fold hydrolase [Bacteroidetes bacterium]|nr:alpha/beta fold hydrolase [Bacteroidota bacterium]HIL58287.1 alpha/beta fold hydrolase [Rhodothermales bacterium]